MNIRRRTLEAHCIPSTGPFSLDYTDSPIHQIPRYQPRTCVDKTFVIIDQARFGAHEGPERDGRTAFAEFLMDNLQLARSVPLNPVLNPGEPGTDPRCR